VGFTSGIGPARESRHHSRGRKGLNKDFRKSAEIVQCTNWGENEPLRKEWVACGLCQEIKERKIFCKETRGGGLGGFCENSSEREIAGITTKRGSRFKRSISLHREVSAIEVQLLVAQKGCKPRGKIDNGDGE